MQKRGLHMTDYYLNLVKSKYFQRDLIGCILSACLCLLALLEI